MNFDTILNNGLDEALCFIRDLPSYSAAKLKKEEFKIVRFEIDYILLMFQEYIKGLPAPGVSLSASHRLLIYNARHVLEGISIVFNVHIDYIQRLYSNYLNYREKKLVPDPENRADTVKPKKKTGKTRKALHTPTIIDIPDSEVPTVRDASQELSFFDGAALAMHSSVVDGAASFERDSRILSSLDEAGNLPEDLELRYRESMKDLTTHLPSEAVPDIAQPEDLLLPIAAEPYQVLDKSSIGLVEQPMDMDFSTAPGPVEQTSVEPSQQELDKTIEEVGAGLDEVKTRKKRVKYKYRVKPIMSNEEYIKFLERKKGFMDPVKYYSKSKKKSLAEELEVKRMDQEFEDPIIRDLLRMAVKEIPVPVLPTYLRDQPLIQTEPGKIPLFEFPITEDDVQHLEAPSGRTTEQDALRAEFEEHSRIRPSTERPEVDEIQNLPLLMTALSLDHIPKTSMPQQFEEIPLPSNLEDLRTPSFPQTHENGRERIPTDSVSMRLDELQVKITTLCAQMDSEVIRFVDLCDISKTKLEAARVFLHLIELWQRRLVFLHQTSSHPNHIFITLSR